MKKVKVMLPTAKGTELVFPVCEHQRLPLSHKIRKREPDLRLKCHASAKIDYRGVALCINHAKSRALAEVMNEGL